MKNYFSRTVIENPDELFGRKDILLRLEKFAINGNCVSITGIRRIGKTSLVKSLITHLNRNKDSQIIPIYIDFKEVGSIVKGTDQAYRYMLSIISTELFEMKIFTEPIPFKKNHIEPSADWTEIYEKLQIVSPVRIQQLFEDLISFFSELTCKTILLIIDEYEWLFRFTFDNPVGFMKLRTFASKLGEPGIQPFSFWVVGCETWSNLCTITGSGELNVIDAPSQVVDNITFLDFQEFWDFELKKINNPTSLITSNLKLIYDDSGGIPYFAKIIGNYLLTNNSKPNHSVLGSYFQEMLESLATEEKDVLRSIAVGKNKLPSSHHQMNLIEKGLIKGKSGLFSINSILFKEYIKSIERSKDTEGEESKKSPCERLTFDVENLIITINETNKNKKGAYIFIPVNDDAALYRDLKRTCTNQESISDFSSSLYKIVFERTKMYDQTKQKDISKATLPSRFKTHEFVNIIDIMRHSLGGGHLMGTFTQRDGQLSKQDMLQILLGSKNEPESSEDFQKIQLECLLKFKNFLEGLNNHVRYSI